MKITIIGKTNSGKSTLFNKIIGEKKSIITKKKNTTLRCIESAKKTFILVDTPGIILNIQYKINKLNKLIYDYITKSNIIIVNINNINIKSEDFFLLELIKKKKKILILNKIDKLKNKKKLLILIEKLSQYSNFIKIFPISNLLNTNIKNLKKYITLISQKEIKINSFVKDKIKIKIQDIIREVLLTNLNKEIPYTTKIEINKNINKYTKKLNIEFTITKKNHKKIIIGKNGQKIIYILNEIKKKITYLKLNIKNIKLNIKYDNKYRYRYNRKKKNQKKFNKI